MKTPLKFVFSLALATLTHASLARGEWTMSLGSTKITPKVQSGDLSAPSPKGSKVDVGADSQPTITLGYALTDRISLSVPIAPAFRHSLYGAGSNAGTGRFATVDALPASLFVQYRFTDPGAAFRPYVAIAPTYVYMFRERGSAALTGMIHPGGDPVTLKVDSKLAMTAQAGLTYDFNSRWFADLFFAKTWVKTTSTLSTGQSIQLTLNPASTSLAIGYRF